MELRAPLLCYVAELLACHPCAPPEYEPPAAPLFANNRRGASARQTFSQPGDSCSERLLLLYILDHEVGLAAACGGGETDAGV